ncbi:MAG: carboxypeptidase regulatory-like domain-containing protein [Blastocatellia bacterium]
MFYRTISVTVLLCLLLRVVEAQAAFSVVGVVLDQNGAALSRARVTIRGGAGERRQTATTDESGAFRFDRLARGEWEVRVEREGFKTAAEPVAVGARAPAPLRIVLLIADLKQDVTVSGEAARVDAEAGNNQDVVILDQKMLNDLPAFDRDVIAMASRFLNAGAIGTGGVTLIVDGMEVTKAGVSASAIQEVRINNNPYSAEYSRAGRGRIEVITKPGASELHGEFNWMLRDARMNARDPFALTRAPEQRRMYEGNLTGPVGKSKKRPMSFLVTAERDEQDSQAVVFARTLNGEVRLNSPTPATDVEFSARVARQMSDKTTLSIQYSYEGQARTQGIGGFNLPEVAVESTFHEDQVRVNYNSILSSRLVHQVNLLLGRYRAPATSVNNAPRLVVQDAFIGGGAQADFLRTEEHWTWNEVLSYSRGRHFIKGGAQIPDFSRRGFDDRTNQLGTFYFASLDDYRLRRPYNYVQQQGRTDLHFWEVVAGAFVMEDFRARPNLSLSAGLRYDWQNYFSDHTNFAPRFGFAYAPGKERKTVLRGGAGVFYDRTGPQPISDILRFDGSRLRRYVLADPGFPNPYANSGGEAPASQPGSVVRLAPNTPIPYTLQAGAGIERQLQKSLTLSVNYIGVRGVDLFRSRDINAPPLPAFVARPDPRFTVIRQIESTGRQTSHSLEIALRGNVASFFNGLVQYAYGRARNDTGGVGAFPANSYDLQSEWGRADFDTRHRFVLAGTLKARQYFKLGLALTLNTGAPYSLTTGRDENRDSFALDRPAGVGRNTMQGPGYAQFDLRWSREFSLSRTKKDDGPKIGARVDAFNIFNRVNFAGFVGNLSSPFFGLPVAARPPRRMQIGLSFTF